MSTGSRTAATAVTAAAQGLDGAHVSPDIEEWIRAVLAQSNGEPVSGISEVHQTAWSTVLAVTCGATRLYFKAVWPAQRHEVAATALLASRTDRVPSVVAADRARCWMLLADAGEPLKRRGREARLALLPEAVRRYAELQVALMPRVADFLAAGVPDRHGLGEHLDRLLAAYPSEREDTLTAAELTGLTEFGRRVDAMERHLEAVAPASIEHGDLHAGNIVVDGEDRTRVFDWGDISVAPPLLSLAVLLGSLEESLGTGPGDARLDAVVDAYLGPFGAGEGAADKAALVRAARLLGSISRAVTWDHIARHVPPEDRAAFPDPVASSLRDCLRLLAA